MSENRPDIEQLAARLDRVLPPGTSFVPPKTKDPLVNTAMEIAAIRFPSLSNNAVNRLEARMLTAYRAQYPNANGTAHRNGNHSSTPTKAPPPASPAVTAPRRAVPVALRWAAAVVLIFIIFAGSATLASAASVPGDLLYPVKRAVEQVELAVALQPSQRASIYLQHAQRRAEEALLLTARGKDAETVITEARQDIVIARQTDPTLAEAPALEARITAINELLEAADNPPATVPPAGQDEQPEAGAPVASATTTPSHTPTATATPSLTRTLPPTATRTPRPTATETEEPTRTPRPSRTPRPPRATPSNSLSDTSADQTPTATPTSRRNNPTRAPTSTACPGNSCGTNPTNAPQGTPGGGQSNQPQGTPNGGNGNNGGNSDNSNNPPGNNPGGGNGNGGGGNDNGGGNGNGGGGNDNGGGNGNGGGGNGNGNGNG